MAEQSGGGAASLRDAKSAEPGVWPLMAMMARALLASSQLKILAILSAATLFVVGATAYGQIRLNAWNKPFYDALARKNFDGFVEQLLVFLVIAAALVPQRRADVAQPDDKAEAARGFVGGPVERMAAAEARVSPG